MAINKLIKKNGKTKPMRQFAHRNISECKKNVNSDNVNGHFG